MFASTKQCGTQSKSLSAKVYATLELDK